MMYDHAVLGESLDICRDAATWFVEEKERLEKSKKVNKEMGERDLSDKIKRKSGE